MANCPRCGRRLVKKSKTRSKYYCENKKCAVIFVRYPHDPDETRIAYAPLDL